MICKSLFLFVFGFVLSYSKVAVLVSYSNGKQELFGMYNTRKGKYLASGLELQLT
jgi:hypothetical protein